MLHEQGTEQMGRRVGTCYRSSLLMGFLTLLTLSAAIPRSALAQRTEGGSVFDAPAPATGEKQTPPAPDNAVSPTPPADDAPPAPALKGAPAVVSAAEESPAASRAAEPGLPAQAAAEKLIRNLYRNDYSSSLPADRQALARKLLEQGKQTTDDPGARFVCLREARDLAVTSADLELAMQAVDAIVNYYAVDEFEWRFKTLQLANGGGLSPAIYETVANVGLRIIDAEVATDDYDKALRITGIVDSAVGRTGRPDFVAHVKDALRRTQSLRLEYQKVKTALTTLQKNPTSAADSLTVGRFYCLSKGDWEKGLPYLKKSSDSALVSLAARELVHPTDAKDQLELADAWWAQTEKTPAPSRAQLQLRAGTWYRSALPQLTGLNQTRVKARLDVIDKIAAGPASRVDLMILIDPSKDAIAGAWQFRDGSLVCDRVPRARLQVPYEPPAEYDFRIVFTRLEGSRDVAQILVSPDGTGFAWIMAALSNMRCGFSLVDHLYAYNNATTVKLARSIENGQRHTSVVQVRRDGVRAYLDGALVSELATDYKNISSDIGFSSRDGRLLGVGAADSVTAFHAIEVMEITGKGKRTR